VSQVIKKYETELRDSHEFDKWKEAGHKKDEEVIMVACKDKTEIANER
jgi:hypothetical protein